MTWADILSWLVFIGLVGVLIKVIVDVVTNDSERDEDDL